MTSLEALRRILSGRVALAASALALICTTGPGDAHAQSLFDRMPTIPGDWTITLGAQGRFLPEFEGASRFRFEPLPIVSVRRAGKAARFRAPLDGAGISLIDIGGFHAGLVGKYKGGRDAGDYPRHLRGLGDVDATIEAGLFAEFWPRDWFRTRIETRRGFGGHRGFVADLFADVVVPIGERWTLSGGPRLSLADNKATAPYFGVDAAQSLASGLPLFNAKGGLHSIGAGLQARYQLTPRWEVRAYVEYARLRDDAASSPLVTRYGSPNQTTVGLGLSYSFDAKLW